MDNRHGEPTSFENFLCVRLFWEKQFYVLSFVITDGEAQAPGKHCIQNNTCLLFVYPTSYLISSPLRAQSEIQMLPTQPAGMGAGSLVEVIRSVSQPLIPAGVIHLLKFLACKSLMSKGIPANTSPLEHSDEQLGGNHNL